MTINSINPVNYYSYSNNSKNDENKLDPQKQQQITKLQAIDAKVKAHEQAHLAAAAGIAAGGANYTYVKGPDGKDYAIAGEVPISISKGKTPKETIQKMQQVIAAALAPADPSPQDIKVAQSASNELSKALKQLNSQKLDIKA